MTDPPLRPMGRDHRARALDADRGVRAGQPKRRDDELHLFRKMLRQLRFRGEPARSRNSNAMLKPGTAISARQARRKFASSWTGRLSCARLDQTISLAAVAGLSLAATSAAAKVMVLRATGPSAASFAPGKVMADDARVTLKANDSWWCSTPRARACCAGRGRS